MKKNFKNILAGCLSGLLLIGCASDDGTTAATAAACGSSITSNITADCTMSGSVTLTGAIKVETGVTLTVAAGTTVYGSTSELTYLLVDRGAKIIAEGTASNPIVFTSGAASGSRSASDWGGIMIAGLSQVSNVAGQTYGTTEVASNLMGCGSSDPTSTLTISSPSCSGVTDFTNDTDNSGILKYVRIEFAGKEITSGSEFNGLFLAGVGNGTTIQYVQAHRGSDDGVEIFGGDVNVSHLVISSNQDDQFDIDDGWRGTASHVVIALSADSDQAIEYDGGSGDMDRVAGRTSTCNSEVCTAQMTNFTILGHDTQDEGLISIRDDGGFTLVNSLIANVYTASSSVDYLIANLQDNSSASNVENVFASNMLCQSVERGGSAALTSSNLGAHICSGSNVSGDEPKECSSADGNLTAAFPDGSSNNTDCSSSLYSAVPTGSSDYWGDGNGAAELVPNATPTVTTYTSLDNANWGTWSNPTYVGAFSGSSDTWANNWTSFPTN